MLSYVKSLATNEDGATAIEYGLIAGLIAVAIIAGATTLGGDLGTAFTTVGGDVTAAVPAA